MNKPAPGPRLADKTYYQNQQDAIKKAEKSVEKKEPVKAEKPAKPRRTRKTK